MKIEDFVGAAVSSLLFVTVLLISIYVYYSLGLPLMLLTLFLVFLFLLQTFELRFGKRLGVGITTQQP